MEKTIDWLRKEDFTQDQIFEIEEGLKAGESAYAEKGIRTGNLGNQAGISTYIKLGIGDRILKKEEALEKSMEEARQELHIFMNAHRELQKKYPSEIRNSMELYLKIESAIYTKEKQLEGFLREKKELEKEKKETELVSAVIEEKLYEGVLIEMNGLRWKAKEVENVTIKRMVDRIAVFSNQYIGQRH